MSLRPPLNGRRVNARAQLVSKGQRLTASSKVQALTRVWVPDVHIASKNDTVRVIAKRYHRRGIEGGKLVAAVPSLEDLDEYIRLNQHSMSAALTPLYLHVCLLCYACVRHSPARVGSRTHSLRP